VKHATYAQYTLQFYEINMRERTHCRRYAVRTVRYFPLLHTCDRRGEGGSALSLQLQSRGHSTRPIPQLYCSLPCSQQPAAGLHPVHTLTALRSALILFSHTSCHSKCSVLFNSAFQKTTTCQFVLHGHPFYSPWFHCSNIWWRIPHCTITLIT
jgi:hypothetical protein